jgi:hypothetical protein
MTICIVWRSENTVHFASDSKLTSSFSEDLKIGVKVLEMDVRVKSAYDARTRDYQILYESTIGMCWSGTCLTAYLVKEIIGQILKRLQYVPVYGPFTFPRLNIVIETYLRAVLKSIIHELGPKFAARFIIAGYCPIEKDVKAFKYELQNHENGIEVLSHPILENESKIDFIGDDAPVEYAKENIKHGNSSEVMRTLKYICEDVTMPSVGGNIQYGSFQKEKFVLHGISYIHEKEDGRIELGNFMHGLEIYRDKKLDIGEFNIEIPFIQPIFN